MSTRPATYRLSKSRFLAGLQCHKQLWWRVHEPDASELIPRPALRNLLNQGTEGGRGARGRGPGGGPIDLPVSEGDNRGAGARRAPKRGPPAVCEGAVPADETYAAA